MCVSPWTWCLQKHRSFLFSWHRWPPTLPELAASDATKTPVSLCATRGTHAERSFAVRRGWWYVTWGYCATRRNCFLNKIKTCHCPINKPLTSYYISIGFPWCLIKPLISGGVRGRGGEWFGWTARPGPCCSLLFSFHLGWGIRGRLAAPTTRLALLKCLTPPKINIDNIEPENDGLE